MKICSTPSTRYGSVLGLAVMYILAGLQPSSAQASIPPDILEEILKPSSVPKYEWTFVGAPDRKSSRRCNLRQGDLIRTMSGERHTYRMLTSADAAEAKSAGEILLKFDRLAVDADGSLRAYHPDDPTGTGQCERFGSAKATSFKGICALDHIANGGVRLFKGPSVVPPYVKEKSDIAGTPDKTVHNPDFLNAWTSIWPLIAKKVPIYVDLPKALGEQKAREVKQRLFYSKEQDLIASFKPSNVPFDGNFPCVRNANSGAEGYFVAATSERMGERVRKDRCDASRYLDASKVPFFVVPIGLFLSVGVGDIAVGYAQTNAGPRLALGVVGDLGPSHKLGESSIAFNQALLNEIEPPMNVRGVNKLDIDLKVLRGR